MQTELHEGIQAPHGGQSEKCQLCASAAVILTLKDITTLGAEKQHLT